MGVIIYGSSLCFGHVRSLFCPLLPLPVWLLLWEGISVRPGPLFLVIRKSDFFFFFWKNSAALHTELLSDKICRFHTWFFFISFNSLSHKQFIIPWQKMFFSWYFFLLFTHNFFYSWKKTKHFHSDKTKISSELFCWDSHERKRRNVEFFFYPEMFLSLDDYTDYPNCWWLIFIQLTSCFNSKLTQRVVITHHY